MVPNVRRDEHEGLVLPIDVDEDTKELFRFELMSPRVASPSTPTTLIQRYEQRILMSVLADFIKVGHEGTGSYAMHVDKTGIFRAALNSIADSIADVFNRYAIPRLFASQRLEAGHAAQDRPRPTSTPPTWPSSAQFMTSMGGLGMTFFPDPDLEKYLRNVAQLPDLPEDVMEQRRVMAMQQHAVEASQAQMGMQGAAQQEEMVNQGASPEQAMMAAEGPTPEIAAQELGSQYKGKFLAEQDPDVKAKMDEEAMGEGDPAVAGERAKMQAQLETESAKTALTEETEHKKFERERAGAREDHQLDQKANDADHKRSVAMEKLKANMARKTAQAKIPPKKSAKKPPPRKKR